jgi:imidazolonepropionase-like amidohydrolase
VTQSALTVYTAERVWTGEPGGTIEGGAVAVRDGHIVCVGRAGDVIGSNPTAARVAFEGGATLMPGLIDCHVHLSGSRAYGHETTSPAWRTARAVEDLGRLVQAGYTTVRDCGGAIALGLREAVLEGSAAGPRILAAGPIISQTGGHGDVHAFPIEWVEAMGDSILADGPDDVRQAVRRACRLNADLIKICTTGGVGSEFDSPHDAHYTPAEIEAIVDEAHRLGRRVASHAQGADGVRNAVLAGVDTIEHGYYLDEAAVEAMLAHGTVFVPTFVLSRVYRDTLEAGTEMPAYRRRKQNEAMDAMQASLRLAATAGVPIASGSDFCGYPLREHGHNARDVVALAEGALGAEGALVAATATAARACGLEGQLGRLAPGLEADMAVFQGNPLRDTSALLAGATAVVQYGRLLLAPAAGAALVPGAMPRLAPARPAA